MECTLATLIACFSWSGLYVDTGIQVQDAGIAVNYAYEAFEYRTDKWVRTYAEAEFRDTSQNPYGRFGIGYVLDFRAAQITLEASHTSSLTLGEDKGINALSLRMRWFPFR